MSKIKYKTISTYSKFNHNELHILRHLSRRCMSIYKKSLRHIKDNYKELNNMAKHYIKENIKKNNQNLIGIPFGRIKNRLIYLCNLHNIEIIIQEESYTSASSFYDNDEIPVYDEKNTIQYKFSGERIQRGLYEAKNGYKFNADINGALNILRKSSVCDNLLIDELRHRGVSTPLRLRVI